MGRATCGRVWLAAAALAGAQAGGAAEDGVVETRHPNGQLAERRTLLEVTKPAQPDPESWQPPLLTSQRWYENGQLHWEGTFQAVPSWEEPRRHPCGLSSCEEWDDHFVDIRPHGRVRRFRDDGSLWTDYQFEDGLRRGRQLRFHMNGAVADDWIAYETMEDWGYLDRRDGHSVRFYPDGSPREVGWYRQGRPVGDHASFWPTHAIAEERRYDDEGREHGVWRRYDEGGALLGEISFEHGQRKVPPPPCEPDAEMCPFWPAAPELPAPQVRLVPAVAQLCSADWEAQLARTPFVPPEGIGARGPDGLAVGHGCTFNSTGMPHRVADIAADGTILRSTIWSPLAGTLRERFELEPGVRERTEHFDDDCLCKTREVVKDLRSGDETVTRWHTSGLLAERGVEKSGARKGRWTFWGLDGSVSHWIEYEGGAEVRRIENRPAGAGGAGAPGALSPSAR
jgi:hypothetical protein